MMPLGKSLGNTLAHGPIASPRSCWCSAARRSTRQQPSACFLDDGDRQRYLHLLGGGLLRYGCLLHAYVLMTNHVHLLFTPAETRAVSLMMQAIGRRYRRQDEIGTPFCVTVDFQTVEEDNAVTIRERDSMSQVRVPIEGLTEALRERLPDVV